MKHLKTYEEILEYNIGDYVIVKSEFFKDKLPRLCKITTKGNEPYSKYKWYDCIMIDGTIVIVSDNMVERKMTSEEIKQFELEMSTNKYNL